MKRRVIIDVVGKSIPEIINYKPLIVLDYDAIYRFHANEAIEIHCALSPVRVSV